LVTHVAEVLEVAPRSGRVHHHTGRTERETSIDTQISFENSIITGWM